MFSRFNVLLGTAAVVLSLAVALQGPASAGGDQKVTKVLNAAWWFLKEGCVTMSWEADICGGPFHHRICPILDKRTLIWAGRFRILMAEVEAGCRRQRSGPNPEIGFV